MQKKTRKIKILIDLLFKRNVFIISFMNHLIQVVNLSINKSVKKFKKNFLLDLEWQIR